MIKEPTHSLLFRTTAWLLVPMQVLLFVPVAAAAPAEKKPRVEVSKPSPPPVKVNRTVPKVTPPPSSPRFSDQPTDAEIFRARVFEEPLVPMGGSTSAEENRALAAALLAYAGGGSMERTADLEGFLSSHPQSAWRPALLLDLGIVYRRTGYFSRALSAWKESWRISKGEGEPRAKALADRALAELATLEARLGRVDELSALLAEAEGRDVHGSASTKLAEARQSLWRMQHRPEQSFRCGPLALERLVTILRKEDKVDPKIAAYPSTPQGTSLLELKQLAESVGVHVRAAKRIGDADIVVPEIVHWKAGHFSSLVRKEGDRYLSHDPTFGDDIWVTRSALNEEATGYALVPDAALPRGWEKVGDQEALGVWGKGAPPTVNSKNGGSNQTTCGGSGGSGGSKQCGMPTYTFLAMLVALKINDIPVGYAPPVGPAVRFEVTYNEKEAYQPQIFTYSNLGPQWTFDWLSYVQDDPANPAANVDVYRRGGGIDTSTGYDPTTQSYAPELQSRAVVVRTSASAYERRLPDGSVEAFTQPDGAMTFPRKVFLTSWADPQGNSVTLTYDESLRIAAIQDAIGQVTTLSYDNPSDPLKITSVTDPFGRQAVLEYDAAGQLLAITDVIGMRSSFQYATDALYGDYISSMTTPYGTTQFELGGEADRIGDPWIQATDPLRGKERLVFEQLVPPGATLPSMEPASAVPTGFSDYNKNLDTNNSVFWDKRAMEQYPGDYTKARIIHWLWEPGRTLFSGVMHSEKLPLENRVWYAYPGQTDPMVVGTIGQPSKVARVLDDGSSQIYRFEYGARGNVSRVTDPVGRTTVYNYDPNNIDLLSVQQVNGQNLDTVATYTYNSQHKILTSTDAAGQMTTKTYYPNGKLWTVTTPQRAGISENRTTTYTYDANGYRQSVTRPLAGATLNYTYDSYGRLQTTTDSEGYGLTYEYDALNRVTKITYPDGTYEQTIYNRLDAEQQRDRLGRWTHTFHDALRRVSAVQEPGRGTTTYQWCNCGSLEKLVDANQNAISWDHDVQGRVTRETRADGSFASFTYENTTSRLSQKTDAKNQIVGYQYFLDDNPKQMSYTNAQVPTANVSFTYDPAYNRRLTMSDGTGTTSYAYNPITASPTLGAGELANVDGPLANDTISYAYDELGRVVARTLSGVTTTWSYDSLARVQGQSNPLGTFAQSYVGTTDRLQGVTYPNGQTTTYSYYPNGTDKRLQDILHKKPDGTTLAHFGYSYDVNGDIVAWTQQGDTGSANVYNLGYDGADQLVSAVYQTTDAIPTILKRYFYAYDPAGNRTAEQIDDAVTGASYDNLNRMTAQQAGGAMTFQGTTSEPATVTIQGKPATTTASNTFTGSAQIPSGTSTVQVQATDPTGNLRTNTYQLSQSGTAKSFTYDSNGNLTGDGARTFEWDAENRLVAINQGTQRTEFTYNGAGERTRILEKTGSAIDADRWFVPCGFDPCEERSASGTVVKRFFDYGFQDSAGTSFYYTKDHVGSLRTVTDSAGLVRARYDYDPYGRRTKLAGDIDSDFGFTSHFYHSRSGLHLAMHRQYSSDLGRWIQPDPAPETDGINAYLYVQNNPTGYRDLLGLAQVQFTVITVIRPPYAEAGIKTLHELDIDTESGSVTNELKFIGSTVVGGKAFHGRGSLSASASGGKGCITAQFLCHVRSALFFLYIDYDFNIKYNANKGKGHLSGSHDRFPSYEVWKDGDKIYDRQQDPGVFGVFKLWGSGAVSVDQDF